MPNLSDRVIAVTGASAGIGQATARALVAAGAKVAFGARRKERIEALAAELGDAAVGVPLDVRRPADAERLVHTAVETFGTLDGLVANAGIGLYGSILDWSDDELADMVDINVNGTVWPIRAALPHLLKVGGDVVIVSSVAGLRGADNEAVYAATKHAQIGLAGSLDRELQPKGVRVSAICPGGVATEFAMGAGRTPDMPGLDDMLRPEDVADAIVYTFGQPRHARTLVWSMRSLAEAD